LQQTTVAAVKAYHQKFTTLWPTVADLAAAEDADVMAAWAGLGYYARARNLLKCARAIVTDHGESFPANYDVLLTLPGIGPYTAAAVAAIAFGGHGPWRHHLHAAFACLRDLPLARPLCGACCRNRCGIAKKDSEEEGPDTTWHCLCRTQCKRRLAVGNATGNRAFGWHARLARISMGRRPPARPTWPRRLEKAGRRGATYLHPFPSGSDDLCR